MSGPTVRCKLKVRSRPSRGRVERVPLAPPVEPVAVHPVVSRPARVLALAHCIERAIDTGEIRGYAQAARTLGLTRARVTQVMNLLLLAPEVQERVLVGEMPVPARWLRQATSMAGWAEQGRLVDRLGPVHRWRMEQAISI